MRVLSRSDIPDRCDTYRHKPGVILNGGKSYHFPLSGKGVSGAAGMKTSLLLMEREARGRRLPALVSMEGKLRTGTFAYVRVGGAVGWGPRSRPEGRMVGRLFRTRRVLRTIRRGEVERKAGQDDLKRARMGLPPDGALRLSFVCCRERTRFRYGRLAGRL